MKDPPHPSEDSSPNIQHSGLGGGTEQAGWVEGWVEACYCVQTRQRPHEDCIAHICTHTHKYVTQTHTHKHTHTNMSHKHTHTHKYVTQTHTNTPTHTHAHTNACALHLNFFHFSFSVRFISYIINILVRFISYIILISSFTTFTLMLFAIKQLACFRIVRIDGQRRN